MSGPVRVLVVGPKYAGADSRGGMATVVSLMREQHDDRVVVRSIATYVDDRSAARLWVGLTGMVRAAAAVAAGRVDVLHVHLAQGGSVVRKSLPLLTARARRVPAVVHAHSFDFAGWFDALPRPVRGLVRWALPARLWLVLGDELAGGYAARLHLDRDRVQVLRNPVRLPGAVPDRTGEPVLAVAFGRLGERKGSYDLVAAVALLPVGVRARLHVVLAGDGELDEVRAAVVSGGVADTVEVRSWVDPVQRDALLAEAEIFLLPSRAEGVPMALLEAMSWGLVPVTTVVGGIGEVVTDGGDAIVVPIGDPASLAAAITSLVTDGRRRRTLGTAARARAAAFGVDTWFDELVARWTQLSAGRG